MRGRFPMKMCPITISNCPVILRYVSAGLFDFDWSYANFNPRETYETRESVFPQRLTTAWHEQSDMEFYEESNGV